MMMMKVAIRRRSISDQVATYTNLNGDNAECSQAPPITFPIGAGEFHSLVVSPVGAIENNVLSR